MDGNDDLLLKTSETVLQMAGIARINDANDETKVFYSHLGSHCVRLRDHARHARQTSSRLNSELVNQALGHLGSLVPENTSQGLLPYTGRLEIRLAMLNLIWSQEGKQHDEAKLEFISRWLRPGTSEEQRREVDKALESCADGLDKQQHERSSKRSTHKFASPDIGEPSYTVWKTAQSIFDALLDCKDCSCPSQHEFGAKLGLGTYRKPEKKPDKKPPVKSYQNRIRRFRGGDDAAGELGFDLFLSMERDWHEVRVQTVKEKVVGFALAGEVVPPRGKNVADRSTRVERLCEPITKAKTKTLQRLILKLTSGQLFEMGFEKSNFRVDKTAEPISLSRCFEERHEFFTEKTKRILSLILSYTVFHLSGTSWLQPGWGSSNIKFFQTTSSCKIPLQPFIQTQLPKASPAGATPEFQLVVNSREGDDDSSGELDSGHRCPALVSLAVVLMEVHFVKSFKALAEKHDIPLIEEPSGRITLIDVDQVFNGDDEDEKEGWRSQIPEDSLLLTAIDNCLDGELWEDEEGQPLDSGTLRSRIYQDVVRPLEVHLTQGFSDIPLDNLDKHARDLDFGKWGQVILGRGPDSYAAATVPVSVRAPTRTPSPALVWFPSPIGAHPAGLVFQEQTHQNLPFHSLVSYPTQDLDYMSNSQVDYKASQFFDDETGDKEYSPAEMNRYLAWKSNYEQVYNKFIKESPSQPVKIAILDTGLDKDYYAFEARKENFKGELNCYDESQKNVLDQNGHGTFAANLILDYAPDAELYIAKIADKKNAQPDTKIVVNAINYAVDKWKVDIISMSFGWPSSKFEGYDALEAAIDKAYSEKVLMFAAASNSGGRLGRAYPASNSHVICVHSTNTYGNRSDFSPTAEPNTINIATVGEAVQSVWPSRLCRDQLSHKRAESRCGTSYATPIVAGISAFLLQYARLHLPESEALALKRKEKMQRMLRRVAERGPNYKPRDGYFYVELSLHDHNLFGEKKEWINDVISKTLTT